MGNSFFYVKTAPKLRETRQIPQNRHNEKSRPVKNAVSKLNPDEEPACTDLKTC